MITRNIHSNIDRFLSMFSRKYLNPLSLGKYIKLKAYRNRVVNNIHAKDLIREHIEEIKSIQ